MIKTTEEPFGEHANAGGIVKRREKYLPESDKMITKDYKSMKEITYEDYRKFLETHDHVVIENVKVLLPKNHKITKFAPENFTPETTTVWSFPDRGDWATHVGNYRGNWSPYIPRNLILRYTKKNDLVLDQMAGSGTTLVECKLLQRCGIGVDINPDAVMVMRNRLDFKYKPLDEDYEEPEIRTYVGDARNLDLIEDESIDLVATHPPYASIIPYSHQRVEGDLSRVHKIAEFVEEMRKIAVESYRVLKPGKHCAILIGDTRRHKHFVPITPRVLQSFLDVGFILREDIIKLQWKMKTTREKWKGKYDFLLIAHEHLYVFRKPEKGEKLNRFKESTKWWNKEEQDA
ncbi:MAG: methyltransferase domain-containing protein [Thermoplasmatales archaeon]|nr:methyltransferase domain-containing protein [Thermoplasmatales archaeon]